MMVRRITIKEASTQFSDLADRVKNSGDEFVVERDGQPLCKISPAPPKPFTVADMVELLRSLEPPDPQYCDAVEEYVRNQPPMPPSPWDS
jgi:antitoxin (DNA-binding transcriptional repressor) of toxin-antitoxin stability system